MKRTVFGVLMLFVAALLLAALPLDGEEEIYDDVIRLHILADSDSEEDQARKLCVRDAILSEWGDLLSGAESRQEAESRLGDEALRAIEETARQALAACGGEDNVRVTLSREHYPTRDYGSFALPEGSYISLRVILGSGEGQNWWCVLFPPLCTAGALDEVPLGLSDAELELICKGKKQVRFRALELLSSLLDR